MSRAGFAEAPEVAGDYRALFEQASIPIAMASVDGDPRFVFASRGFLDTFDLTRAAVVGRAFDQVLAPAGSAELAAAVHRCLVTSESVRTSVELHDDDSRRRMIGVAVHSAHARGFANHVLLEASAQGHAIHTFEKRLSALFDQAGGPSRSMTYIHDLKRQRIRYVDGGLASQIGLSGGALPYSEWLARIHPEEQNSLAAYHLARTGLSDDEFITSTVRVRDSKDEWRLINLRARVLRRDPDGAPRLLVGRAMDISDYADAAVQAAGVTMLRAEENERARIGRELHDSTSQYLIAADLGLARVLRNEGLSDDDRARLRDVQESLATVQTEMRALTFFLHPPEVGELGLVRTIERFCAGFARRSGLEIPFVSDSAPKDLPGDAEHALFRVCQEALMNVYRHAFARRVTVSLTVKDAQVTLEVRDDGIGVDSAERFQQGGIGVAGMRKRMQNVGGELVLDYSGPGLAVVARVPLPAGDVA